MFSRRWSKKLRLDAKRLQVESLEDRIVMSAAALTGSSLPEVEPALVQTSAALLSTEDWVHSLAPYQFNLLLPEHVPYLTTEQVAAIPTTGSFNAMSVASRAALNATQVQSLNVANVRITLLTSQQIGYLTAPQIQSLPVMDFAYLSPAQIPQLTSSQIASIPTSGVLNTWSAASRAALTISQVRSLDMSVVRTTALSATQISWLTAAQIQSLAIYDLNLLTPSQIPYLSTAQIAAIPTSGYFGAWSAASRAALTAPQIQAIRPAALSLSQFTSQQIAHLTTAQIQSRPNWEFVLLSPTQIPQLTASQIASIPSTGGLNSWSAASRAALTMPQVQALNMSVVRTTVLNATQISWLTPSQIQSLAIYDLNLLPPSQIPHLSWAQIAAIPATGYFNAWTPAARAALTDTQIRAIQPAALSLSLLTPLQITYLTPAQIRTLPTTDFQFLSEGQIPQLTLSQIAAIPSTSVLNAWSAAARAALTVPQVRSLNMSVILTTALTPAQISLLTGPQIQSLAIYDLILLTPIQIPYISAAQIAAIPAAGYFNAWSAAARAALTAPQIQAIAPAALSLSQLTSQQIGYLTVGQIQYLSPWELALLYPSQIPAVTSSQIASLSTLTGWTAEARAAMTPIQVRAINLTDIRISSLTSQQVSYLTTAQIQSLQRDWEFLNAAQVPLLTSTQIGGVASLSGWSAAARNALTMSQVRALNASTVEISLLHPAQIGWLTTAQLQALPYTQFAALNPSQIPLLLPEQFAYIEAAGVLHEMPDASEAMLTRAQLLSLPSDVLATYIVSSEAPSDYHPATHMPIGSDGLPTMPHMAAEMARFFALAPLQLATHVTVGSGDWYDPAIWSNGVVPTAGARVVVAAGTTVRFNAYMNFAIDTLRIDGKLHFSTYQNTQLKVDTVVVTTTGVLHIGTEADPIQNHVTARILIADAGPIDLTQDPYQLGRGIVSRGEVKMHGMDVTPYATLAVEPGAGDTKLHLTAPPTNWRVGDRLVVTGTIATRDDFGADEVQIIAINGSEVTVQPLRFYHYTPPGYGLTLQVANLTRNVQLVAEDPTVIAERPHLVFFHNPNVTIDNISVEGFGRTDKTQAVTDPVVVNGVLQPGTGANPRARYAMHFHHTGVNPAYAPAIVRGSVVVGSPGWGFVNHSSNVDFEDNIAYQVVGAGFATEDGNEIGSMRRNLALNTIGGGGSSEARRHNHDFASKGHGFWFQGPGIEIVDNIAAGSANAGFTFFTSSYKNQFDAVNLDDPSMAAGHEAVPVGVVPLKQFSGNTAYAGRVGVDFWHHMSRMNDGQTYIDDFTSWNNQVAGIEAHYTGRLTIRNATLIGDLANPTGTAFVSNRFTHDITFENLHAAGFEVGIMAPVRGATVVSGGYIAAIQAVYVEKGHDARRTVDIGGGVIFASLNASQLQGRRQYTVYMSTHIDYEVQWMSDPDSFFHPDVVTLRLNGQTAFRLYSHNQLRWTTPFNYSASGVVPDEYVNRRNSYFQDTGGKLFGGQIFTVGDFYERGNIFGIMTPLS